LISGGFQVPKSAEPPLDKYLNTPLLILICFSRKKINNNNVYRKGDTLDLPEPINPADLLPK